MQIKKQFAGFVWLGCSTIAPGVAQAQWTVFDPTTWAMMGKIWKEDVSTGAKMSQELQQGWKLYQNAVQIYGLASQEASFLKNKQILLAAGFLAQHAMIPGHPGWDKALTAASGIAYAGAAWQQMTAPGGINSFQAINARIQMADSFGASALNSIGSCNAAAAKTDGSISSLEQMAIDMNPNANTRANQANLNNMSQTQRLRIEECQHNLALQQAQMQVLKTATQRDEDQRALALRSTSTATVSQYGTGNTAQDITSIVDR